MIYVHDKGRLANNILQYGHFYAWGREHGRQTVSMRFAYKYQYFHICHTRHHNFLTYVFAKFAAKWHLLPLLRFTEEDLEPDCRRQKEQEMLRHASLVVTGWEARWYDLFLKYRADIAALFAFDAAIERHAAGLLHDGLRLGVHIRRGDYAGFYGGRFLYSDEVYADVARRFVRLHPGERVTVYICGNDPAMDRDLFRRNLADCEVVFPDGNPGEDLCLLSHCHYLIGAPSTFTLVAAMYRDLPLYWIEDPAAPVTEGSFRKFDYLFQHIY